MTVVHEKDMMNPSPAAITKIARKPARLTILSVRVIVCPTRDGGRVANQGFFALVAMRKLISKKISVVINTAPPAISWYLIAPRKILVNLTS